MILPQHYQAIKYSNYIVMARLVSMVVTLLVLFLFYKKNRENSKKSTISRLIIEGIKVYVVVLIPRIMLSYLIYNINIEFGRTTMALGTFFELMTKSYVMEFVLYIFVLFLILFFFSRKRSFFMELSIILSILVAGFTYIYPLYIQPLFFHAREVRSEELISDVQNLSKRFGIGIKNIYVIDASKYTTSSNAYVFGLFSSLQVVIYDNMLKKFPKGEIRAILAHEFSHYALHHLYLMILSTILFLIFGFWIVEKIFVMDRRVGKTGEYSTLVGSDIYRLILIIFVVIQILNIAGHYVERHGEAEADRCAIYITGLKRELVSSLSHLYVENLSHPSPSFMVKVLFYTHFPPRERIKMIMELPSKSATEKSRTHI